MSQLMYAWKFKKRNVWCYCWTYPYVTRQWVYNLINEVEKSLGKNPNALKSIFNFYLFIWIFFASVLTWNYCNFVHFLQAEVVIEWNNCLYSQILMFLEKSFDGISWKEKLWWRVQGTVKEKEGGEILPRKWRRW